MNQAIVGILGGLSAIIGLAIVAVLVSKNSQTGTVIKSAGSGLSAVILAAVSPITAGTGGSGADSVSSALGLSNSTGNNYYTA
jgi:hypothetical protein